MESTLLFSSRRVRRLAPFGLFLLCAGALTGCIGGSDSESEPEPAKSVEPLRGQVALGEFVLHVQPKLGRATIVRSTLPEMGPAGAKAAPGFHPQAFTDVNLQQDEVTGSGPTNSVELATDQGSLYVNDAAKCGTSPSFCANVTLNSFWARNLSNVYAEVTSITDSSGNAITGHGGINSDNPPTTCTPTSGCPSKSLGLWRYTQSGADLGVLTAGASATRQWVFANPDDLDTYVTLRVVATLTYASYTLASSLRSVANACTGGGTQVPTTVATRTVNNVPFRMGFYNQAPSTTVKFNKRGQFTIGTATIVNSGNNVLLPDATNATHPAVFVFWDNIDYGSAGMGMCYQTVGSAPQRQFVMTWQDMTIAGTTTSHMTFSAAIREGSDEIDLYYQSMTGPNQRSRGSSATVGAQDPSGTLAASGSTFNQALYTTSKAFTLIPVP